MCKIKIIISISSDNRNQFKNCLESINNQTLNNIEILAISKYNKIPIIDTKIKVFNSISQALTQSNGEYILFIDEDDYLKSDACDLLYNTIKNNNFETLYVPVINKYIKTNNETFQKITPFEFTPLCKKSFLDDLTYKNLFYGILQNSKKKNIINQKILFRDKISRNNIEKYTWEIINQSPYDANNIFTILLDYLLKYPLDLKHPFYHIIKSYFEISSLNKENQKKYNYIVNSDNLIDFLTEYSLNTLNYEIYENHLAKNKNYKISVIIPIFNNELFVHRTLISILNQSFDIENIEVLMINDSSTDNTKNVVNEYVDNYPNFKAVHIKNGTGSAGTPRNIGLKLASSEYVLFIDHDDFLEINALEKLYKKIKDHPCDFVYGTYVLINAEQSIKFTYPNEKHGFFKNLEDNPRSITTPPSIWTKLFKREFLIRNKILFPTILGEDAIFMAKALKNANGIYYLWEDIITYYNLNESSFSTNLSYNYFVEGFKSEEYLYNLFQDWDEIEYYKIRGEGILDFYLNRLLFSNLSNNEITDLFPLLHKFCNKLNQLTIKPKLEKNKIVFEYIINNDLKGFLKFKNYKPSNIKLFTNKILNKINKHGFW